METIVSTHRGVSAAHEPTDRRIWQRVISRLARRRPSGQEHPHPALLLPTYEATDRELREFAEPVFRERIDQIRTEAFTRYVTGGKYP
jgi:hypothetical protein